MSLWDIQLAVNNLALDMMLRGVRVDVARVRSLDNEIEAAMYARLDIIGKALGKPVSETFPRSNKQIRECFVALGQKAGIDRKTGRETFNDETLFKIASKTPPLRQVCFAIMEYRQLGQALSTVVRAKLDEDGRMRCSFNTAGPETFRWSSSKNAFWRGCNMQNVTTGDRGLTGAKLPNLRVAFIPDEGCLMWEPDLAGADAQIVAWEADDPLLKQMFREKVKIHAELAKELYGAAAGPDGKREPYYTYAKKLRHAFHYLSGPRTTANSIGIPEAEVAAKQARLRQIHPAVVAWQRRVDNELRTKHALVNRFGYRIICFKRPEDELPDMLAWIGQGTVAHIMNRVLLNIRDNVPDAELLLNEHDSTVGQTPEERWAATKPLLREQFLKVVVPYPEPLVIPPDLKTSRRSWGEMEKEAW